MSGWTVPELTTIRQPLQEMGQVALNMVLELDQGRTLASQHIELATQLIVRSSTAAPGQQSEVRK